MTPDEIRDKFVKSYEEHKMSSPHDGPVRATDGITICSCGARWRTFYSRLGLEWKPLNEQCDMHDAAQAALPADYGLDQEGGLFYEPA